MRYALLIIKAYLSILCIHAVDKAFGVTRGVKLTVNKTCAWEDFIQVFLSIFNVNQSMKNQLD